MALFGRVILTSGDSASAVVAQRGGLETEQMSFIKD
jgi:hypothetical protein